MNTINQQNREIIDKVVDELTLFDDDLMGRVFDKNIEATELLLRIILNRRIKVISVVGQDEMRNHEVSGRNITLDVHAVDEHGQEMDIEVQGDSAGAHVRRARFHSSMMDSRMLKSGQQFKELKDSYVIFIYKRDKFKKGLPLYHINRYVGETEELFDDGSHIIYVNGNYKGDDELGRLMRDFHQSDADNMYYEELAQGVKHYKETDGGREDMGEVVQRYAEKYAKQYAKQYAEQYGAERELQANIKSVKNLMNNMKVTVEQALNALGIQGNDRVAILKELQK